MDLVVGNNVRFYTLSSYAICHEYDRVDNSETSCRSAAVRVLIPHVSLQLHKTWKRAETIHAAAV